MTTNESTRQSARRRSLAAVGWIATGFLLAVFLLADPLGFHPVDEWLAGVGKSGDKAEDTELWTCGMHPNVIQDEPGQCPICQMDLVPMRTGEEHDHDHATASEIRTCPEHPFIEESEPGECPIAGRELVRAGPEADTGVVRIDPAVVQNMNVRTEPVARRDLSQRIRTVGYIEYDQERMVTVTTKYSGWVEKVHAIHVGEPVKKGQPLFEIYSPELVQTAQELLSALAFARRMDQAPAQTRERALAMVEAARTRLGYWDISAEQIAALEQNGEVFRTLTVVAPAGGLIMKRMLGLEGMAVQPGIEAYHIADLSTLWLSVEVFEDQLAWIREGTPAEITFTYFPGKTFRGEVRYLDPEFSAETRTLRVKLRVPNPQRRLRAGMFATVTFDVPALEQALTVPSLAVLRTGERNVVVVALGEGRFAPREIELGQEHDGWAEVLAGLEEGEQVVTSAQFLLDSESSLRESVRKMIAQAQGHAGH